MLSYFFRRLLYMLIVVWVTSIVTFTIIQLPAGDFVDNLAVQFARSGREVNQAQLDNLRKQFGLDQPLYGQYLRWMGNVLQGNLGWSFQYQQRVEDLIGDRIGLTVAISLSTLVFTYLLAIPIGIYSATHQYSIGGLRVHGCRLLGLATPNVLLALILMYVFLNAGMSVGGLFSPEYMREPWSINKVIDLIKHLPLPIIIIGTAGTAGLYGWPRCQDLLLYTMEEAMIG